MKTPEQAEQQIREAIELMGLSDKVTVSRIQDEIQICGVEQIPQEAYEKIWNLAREMVEPEFPPTWVKVRGSKPNIQNLWRKK